MLAQSAPELKVADEDDQAHRKHIFHGHDSSSKGFCFVKYITQVNTNIIKVPQNTAVEYKNMNIGLRNTKSQL